MKKVLSVILSIAMLVCCIPVSFAADKAEPGELLLAAISDLHYFPASLATYKSEAFYTYMKGSNAVYEDMDGILDATFEALANDALDKGLEYVIVSGDLTTNGEHAGHLAVAEKLRALEEETGLKVFVINGNHDINNSDASEFTTPDLSRSASEITTAADFYEIYKEFGFEDAYSTFASDIKAAAEAGTPGALSYSVNTDGGYRLIFIDAGKYSEQSTKAGKNEHETAGNISDELLTWILAQAKDAADNGQTPIAVTHWNLSEMNYLHGEVLQGFTIDNAYQLQEIFADAGIHFVFSGHQHASDIDVTVSDSGEPLYSCIIPTLTQFPFIFRETMFTRDDQGTVKAEYKQYPCDRDKKVKSLSGEEYEQPYAVTTGCAKQMGDTLDASAYLLNMIKKLLSGYITDIQIEGSILGFIKNEFDFDLEDWLKNYIPDTIILGGDEVFSLMHIMDFINDLDEQLCAKFIDDPNELLWPTLDKALDNILAVRISDVPCTKFIDTYGFGDPDKGGTIGDLFLSALVYMYPGNEDISDDLFIQDVIKASGTTDFVDIIFDTVIRYVVDDVVFNTLLGEAEVHLDTLISGGDQEVRDYVRLFFKLLSAGIRSEIYKPTSLDDFMAKLRKMTDLLESGQSLSYRVLIENVLSTGLISLGSSVDEIVYGLLDNYISDTQKQAAARQLSVIASDLFIDDDKDYDVTYIYSGPVEVTPTVEDMQLPNDVNMCLGTDPSTSFNVKWMTKYSVAGTDIEIIKDGGTFKGTPTVKGVEAEKETKEISGFGFDFGTFGILPWTREVNVHTVRVTGLTPGTTYRYRIGDFEKGFVSEGSITTADNNDKFTFAFVSDPAGVSPDMYTNFADAVKTAADKNDLSFIINGGNSVCSGDNEDQWGWALNTARDTLLNTPVQYVSGKGDVGDTSPVTGHFTFAELPAYAESLYGVYYSFEYENTHFTVINTNELDEDGTLTVSQLKWLDQDLGSTDATWKVLVMNTPLYGANAVGSDLQAQLLNLIDVHSVDLVLGGSDSSYERTYVIDEDAPLPNNPIAIKTVNRKVYETYINVPGFVSVTGCFTGSEFTDKAPSDNRFKVSAAPQAPVYSVINVDGEQLAVDTYRLNADGSVTVIDSFAMSTQNTLARLGDVNFDGEVTAADARLVLRATVRLETFEGEAKIRADVNCDKQISAADARLILRDTVNLEKILPEYINYKMSDIAVIKV